jgi:initiation factor 1A
MTGEIIKILGDGRYGINCYDKTKRIGLARGVRRRHMSLQVGDTVEVTLREFEPLKCDIIDSKV